MKQIARNVTAEVLTLRGLVTYYVVFFTHLEGRRVGIGWNHGAAALSRYISVA
jgi:hypothetical protein